MLQLHSSVIASVSLTRKGSRKKELLVTLHVQRSVN